MLSFEVDPGSSAETKINEKQIIQYDSHKNPLKVFEPLTLVTIYDIPGEHNVLKELVLDATGKTESTTVNTFVYDADKYPLSGISTETPAHGLPEVTKFKYYYNK